MPSFGIRAGAGTRLIHAFVESEDFAIILNIVISLVMATSMGGAGTALFVHGPAGWVVGLVLSLVVLAVGSGRANHEVKTNGSPVRRLVPEHPVESSLHERTDELRLRIADTSRQCLEEIDVLRRSVAGAVRRNLNRSADVARLLIR